MLSETDFQNIPEELKAIPNWLNWKQETKPSGVGTTKVPYVSGTKRRASYAESKDWSSYAKAVAASALIGFVIIASLGYIAVDLDGCLNPSGEPTEWAQQILDFCGSYAEITPSGNGLRIWVKGSLSPDLKRAFALDPSVGYGGKVRIELFANQGYVTMTGDVFGGAFGITSIHPVNSSELYALVKSIAAKHPLAESPKTSNTSNAARHESSCVETNLKSVPGNRTHTLMHGAIKQSRDIGVGDHFVIETKSQRLECPSQSEAEFALISCLVNQHGDDFAQVWADFQKSPLATRGKYDERSNLFRREFEKALESKQPPNRNKQTDPKIAPAPQSLGAAAAPAIEEPAESAPEVWKKDDNGDLTIVGAPVGAPQLSNDALYGLAGDIVCKLEPQTESHPAAALLQTLMMFGNIIGRTAHTVVENTRMYCNIFGVKVGRTAKARKGIGYDRIAGIFQNVDLDWFQTRNFSGLSSGEGFINAVHDDEFRIDPKHPERAPELVPGVLDKRLFTYEGEFSQILTVMTRDGNSLGDKIRNAWDGKPLCSMTIKPRRVTNHHISILADITGGELRTKLTSTEIGNGFANRFLWVYVDRTKLLPFGGEDIDWAPEVERLKDAVEFARQQGRIFWADDTARKAWSRFYESLNEREEGGIVGAILSRGDAQTVKIAMLYALLDKCDHIGSEHLKAAIALWTYCEESVRFIFDAPTADQETILEFLRQHGDASRSDIHRGYHGHRKAEAITSDLATLLRRNHISVRHDKKGVEKYHAI